MNFCPSPLSTPIIYSLELTSFCNNQCRGCCNVFTHNHFQVSSSYWKQILDCLVPHVQVLKLTGGEPTLHPGFEDIVLDIAKRDILFTLFTNGRWNKPEQIIKLLESVSQCGGLLVSLHGADEISHRGFVGSTGHFEETTANIHLAVQAGLRVHTSTVITRWNAKQIEDIAKLSQALGAHCAVFNRYIGPENSQLEPDNEQLLAAIASIRYLQRKGKPVKFGNCIPQCFAANSSRGCWAGIAYCTIDPRGNMRPCNHSPLVVGNVLEQSIERLWHSEKMEHWRALITSECKQCAEFFRCHGGCTAMAEVRRLNKDPLATKVLKQCSDTSCEMVLFEGARPMMSCRVKPENFGYVLIHGASIYPVPNSAKPLLDAYDGQNTLKDILKMFGQEALNFTGALCEQGLVELLQ